LSQCRVALALGDQTVNDTECKGWDALYQMTDRATRQIADTGLSYRFSRPNMHAAAKDFRTADEMSRSPIGQRNLPPRNAGIIGPNLPLLDQKNTFMRLALHEDTFARRKITYNGRALQNLRFFHTELL